MPKDDLVYVGHMIDTARKVETLLEGKDRADFDRDEVLRLALTHLIQIIGEAARGVTQELRDANTEIPWSAIVGMRHRVVHDYLDVDEDVVWDTATRELPQLVTQLERLAPPAPADPD